MRKDKITQFKAKVDRAAALLLAAGHDIQQTKLLDAASIIAGSKSWAEHQAKLGKPYKKGNPDYVDLKGKRIKLFLESHSVDDGGAPPFCFCYIDQAWLDLLLETQGRVREMGHGANMIEIDDLGCDEWLAKEEWSLRYSTSQVFRDGFLFEVTEKHTGGKIESRLLYNDELIPALREAVKNGSKELVLLDDASESELDQLRQAL